MAKAARLHSGLLVRGSQAVPAADAGRGPRHRLRSVPAVSAAALAAPGIPGALPSAQPASAPPPPAEGERVRLTLRLDRRRHRQLKILAATTGRTSQHIVVAALESYLVRAARACACLRGGEDSCRRG